MLILTTLLLLWLSKKFFRMFTQETTLRKENADRKSFRDEKTLLIMSKEGFIEVLVRVSTYKINFKIIMNFWEKKNFYS